jgi:xanthosine utilization system XapX-like protein
MLLMMLTAVVGVALGVMCGLTIIDVWEKVAAGGQAHNAPATDAHIGPHITPDRPDDPRDQQDAQDGLEALPSHRDMDSKNGE